MAPRVSFVIGGVQKGGTTALARFVGCHPRVALPLDKEAHLFDDAGFDERWSPAEVDARYAAHFAPEPGADLFGDATPIYILHPRLVRRIAAYNPAMKWILILRHPIERAVSQYHMERSKGREHLPFWLALLRERGRLRGHGDDVTRDSPLSKHSYRLRGDYARQLDVLYRCFAPEQVLVLRNEDLARTPDAVMDRLWRFLGIEAPPRPAYGRVFEGGYAPLPRSSLRWRFYEWMFRRELDEQSRRYGLDWTGPAPGEGGG
ncbi:sulfotransferase family protein [Luteimonas marina]|nr:sulfotransferase [Luteimonas marina]